MKPFKLVAISGIILFFLWSNPVFAERFNIPPGPLEQALDAYAETTGQNPKEKYCRRQASFNADGSDRRYRHQNTN